MLDLNAEVRRGGTGLLIAERKQPGPLQIQSAGQDRKHSALFSTLHLHDQGQEANEQFCRVLVLRIPS